MDEDAAKLDGPAGSVLLVAPRGADVALRQRIMALGYVPLWTATVAETPAPDEEMVALVVAAEALDTTGCRTLENWLAAQAQWSDLPVLLLADETHAVRHDLRQLVLGANATLAPAVLPEITLASWLNSARRTRRRQREAAVRQLELEQARRLGRVLTDLLGHDLRSPLAAAQLSAEVILRASSDSRALGPAVRVVSSVQRVQRLVDELLDYIRLDGGGGLPVRRRDVDAGEVCRRVLARVGAAQPDTRLLFEEHGDPHGEWDPDRVAQLVESLLVRAVRHGRPGEPVSLSLDGTADQAIRIAVEDASKIDEAAAQAVFEPFGSAALLRDGPEAYGRADEGLALYLARQIARAHGGELVLDPCGYDTTRFVATLPRRA